MGFFGDVFSSLIGASSSKKQRRHELQMLDMSQNFEREMFSKEMEWQRKQYDYEFKKEAEYNDPSAQMERLTNAGLNPYMMLDGGNAGHVDASASSSASGSAPGYQLTDQNKTPQMLGAMSDLLSDVGNLVLGNKNLKNDTNLKSANVGLLQTEMEGKEIDNMYKHQSYLLDLRGKYLDNIKKGVDVERSKREVDRLDREIYEMRESWSERLKSYGLSNQKVQSDIDLTNSQTALNNVMTKINELKIPFVTRREEAIIERELAEASYFNESAETIKQMRPYEVEELMWKIGERAYDGMVKGYEKAGVTLSDSEKKLRRQLYMDYVQESITNLKSQSSNNAGFAGYFKTFLNGIAMVGSAMIGAGMLRGVIGPKSIFPTKVRGFRDYDDLR